MGISGLLKILEEQTEKKHLKTYEGKRVAVDAYAWIHKALYMMKSEIFENPKSKKFIPYLLRRIDQLLDYRITPVVIFDGDKLPMKREKEEERERKREKKRKLSQELLAKGKEEIARQQMIEAIDVNPEMAYQFILELKKKRVEFIVAPYEADVQLAYLARIKYVDFVITEDSDLIALGCKNILFKLDLDTAYGYELRYENIQKCSKYDFTRYDEDKFLQFCILSGCDYFKLKGVGCKKAYNVMKEKSNYKENIEILRRLHNNDISQQDLVEKFEKAFLTFKYQVIYCPIEKATRYSNDVLNSPYNFLSQYNQLDFLGKILDANTAREIAYSIIDPITHKKFENKFKDSLLRSSDYRPRKFNCLYNEPFTVSYNTARTKDENAATHVDLILSKELLYKDCGISNKENDFSSNFQNKMFKIVTNNKQSRSFLLRLEKKLSN